MPHRGRLNTLWCVFEKNMESIFAEFQEKLDKDSLKADWGHSGDVKYHMGCTTVKPNANTGKSIKLVRELLASIPFRWH